MPKPRSPHSTLRERSRVFTEKMPRLYEKRLARHMEIAQSFAKGAHPTPKQQEQIRKTMITAELEAAAKRLEAHRARQL